MNLPKNLSSESTLFTSSLDLSLSLGAKECKATQEEAQTQTSASLPVLQENYFSQINKTVTVEKWSDIYLYIFVRLA
jgi:hypothetical protein